MTKKQMNLIITIFLGMFGVHKFIEKNNKMGFIYLFTLGLFGIGWIIDVVKLVIEVINEEKNKVDIPAQDSIIEEKSN